MSRETKLWQFSLGSWSQIDDFVQREGDESLDRSLDRAGYEAPGLGLGGLILHAQAVADVYQSKEQQPGRPEYLVVVAIGERRWRLAAANDPSLLMLLGMLAPIAHLDTFTTWASQQPPRRQCRRALDAGRYPSGTDRPRRCHLEVGHDGDCSDMYD